MQHFKGQRKKYTADKVQSAMTTERTNGLDLFSCYLISLTAYNLDSDTICHCRKARLNV